MDFELVPQSFNVPRDVSAAWSNRSRAMNGNSRAVLCNRTRIIYAQHSGIGEYLPKTAVECRAKFQFLQAKRAR